MAVTQTSLASVTNSTHPTDTFTTHHNGSVTDIISAVGSLIIIIILVCAVLVMIRKERRHKRRRTEDPVRQFLYRHRTTQDPRDVHIDVDDFERLVLEDDTADTTNH